MYRREVLVGFVSALSAGGAGCSALEPPPESTPENSGAEASGAETTTATATPTQYERRLVSFRSQLREQEIEIRRLLPEEDWAVVSLEYLTAKSTYQEIGGEIGGIAGQFFNQVGQGWGVDRLDATIFQDEDTPFGTWYAETSWYREFQNEEITSEQLSIRVLDTLERANE
jgi:hypothetical protein